MASNIRRSKRTFSQRFLAAENQVIALTRRPTPTGIGARTITSDMIAPGAIDGRNLTVGLNDSLAFVQASANGKNTIYRQPTEPSGGIYRTGDIWFDTAHDNRFSRYKEDPNTPGWFAFGLGDDAIDNLSATKLTAGTIDASQITVSNLDAGNMTVGTLVGRNIVGNYLYGGSIDIGGTNTSVSNKQVTSNVAILTTLTAHGYSVGDVILVKNLGAPFDGEFTVTAVTTSPPHTLRYAVSSANIASTADVGVVFSKGGANSFHVDTTGRIWSGASLYENATFKVSAGGSMTATSGLIGGWSIGVASGFAGSIYAQNGADLSLMSPTGVAWFTGGVLTTVVSGFTAPVTTGGSTRIDYKVNTNGTFSGFLRNISYGATKPDLANRTVGDIHFS